ncbi:glucoamylase family protein [Neolewinella xylanilytica]|nr:glucoamylase family protein [Neolewinella xylanilytica]
MKLALLPYRAAYLGLLLTVTTAVLRAQAGTVTGVTATAYDHHVEINWEQPADPSIDRVRIYGSTDGETFNLIGSTNNVETRLVHFVGDQGVTGRYFLRATGSGGTLGEPSDTVSATTYAMSDSALLDMVQEYTLRYFYDFGHPVSGMARERNAGNVVTTGGTGFGLMALIVGAERGFITYDQALERTNKIVDFLGEIPRFHGAFAHWYNGSTGEVIPFSAPDNGGDLVETAFLMQGLLTARQYFAGDGEAESGLRDNINELWAGVDWNWYRNGGDVLLWHWSPDFRFQINLPIRGFNETHIVYLLAAASPTEEYRIPASLYHTGWAGGSYETNNVYYGIPLLVGELKGGPLFFSHYSYMGFDPRGITDDYANYFVRNTNHTRINYQHALDNPYNREGYGPNVWGITASDDPDGYAAHSPNSSALDNGTIAPTAALGSMPYTPEESMNALKYFYRELGDRMWGPYGFYDAFNLDRDWYADSYLAIDQGPIINMIENHRSGLLWDVFMTSPEIDPALTAVGFVVDTTTTTAVAEMPAFMKERPTVFPNPATDRVTLSLHPVRATTVSVDLLDASGRPIRNLIPNTALTAGRTRLPLHLRSGATSGLYFLRIRSPDGTTAVPLLLNR